jgi:hypothetical protein
VKIERAREHPRIALARGAEWLAPIVPLAAALSVWAPLRDNYFTGDDFPHLYDIVTRNVPTLLGQFWGGHSIGVFNIVTLAFFRLFGPEPRPYFYAVLLVHLANTALLYRAIRCFTGRVALACFGATLWGSSPVLEGALGWYSVFGQVLLTTIVLGILSGLGRLVQTGRDLSLATAARWALLLAIGSACFGMGLGVTATFPVAVAMALPRAQLPVRSVVVLLLGAAATLVIYRVAFTLSPTVAPNERAMLGGFTTLQALPEVLAFHWHLFGFGAAVLVSDLVGFYQSYPDWTQAVGAAGLALCAFAGVVQANGPGRRRLLALAVLAAGTYGAVAAGRAHLFDVVQLPLAQAARWARYQYLPLSLVTLLVCVALAQLATRGRVAHRTISAVTALWVIARLTALVGHPFAIKHADDERAEVAAMLGTIRREIAATPPGKVALIENHPFSVSRLVPRLMPGWAGIFVVYFPQNTVDDRPVRFLVSDADWSRAQERGGRIAELVVKRQ